ALFRLVFAILWLIAPLNSLAALRLLGDAPYLKVFEADRLQALARVQLAGSFDDYYVGLPFFGLAVTVCAWLWLKSGYIPKGLLVSSLSCWSSHSFFCSSPTGDRPMTAARPPRQPIRRKPLFTATMEWLISNCRKSKSLCPTTIKSWSEFTPPRSIPTTGTSSKARPRLFG